MLNGSMDRTKISIEEPETDDAGWIAQLEALGSARAPAMAQWPTYGAIAASGGRQLRRLVFRARGAAVGAAQVLGRALPGPLGFGRALWLISRGPVFAPELSPDVQRACLRAAARHLPGVLIATPEMPLRGRGLIPLVTPRHQAIWDLGPEPQALRAGLAQKWRNRLAAAERGGITVRDEPDPAWLFDSEAAQRRARGYRALPAAFVTSWERAAPGSVLTLRAEDRTGARLAGIVVLRHGTGASYQIGWTGPEGRASGAHNLLIWQAALRLRAQGVKSFDLGDVNSEAGAGLMRFKLGTGAQAASLGATCLILPG